MHTDFNRRLLLDRKRVYAFDQDKTGWKVKIIRHAYLLVKTIRIHINSIF